MSDQQPPHTGSVFIGGIVAARDHQPYIQIDVDGRMIQLQVAAARQIANDIMLACARTEADAMILKFFSAENFPAQAAPHIMVQFREFREKLDEDLDPRPTDIPRD